MSDRREPDGAGSPEDPTRLPPMSRGMHWFAIAVFFVLGLAVSAFVFGDPLGLGLVGDGRPEKATEQASASAAVVYQCPMHPEVVQDRPGSCPICGMDLVAVSGGDGPGSTPSEPRVLYWYDPLDPSSRSDAPGVSPLGLKLVPEYAEPVGEHAGEVRIDPVQVQNIGVVSEPARSTTLRRTRRTVGIVDYDAERVSWINTKVAGWVEDVFVTYVGQRVEVGQPLFTVYSPELVRTQEEYVRALDYRASLGPGASAEVVAQADGLARATRERLATWDVREDQIARLARERTVERTLTVHAATAGVVVEVMQSSLEGMHVRPGMNLYKLADLSSLWVHADVYESDLPWIREDLPATITFRHDPTKGIRGRVLFLYPEVAEQTRTLKVCVAVDNVDGSIRPGMYAEVVIEGPEIERAVVVPETAVIRTGERALVFLDLGDGRFRPREVRLGAGGAERTIQIVSGVAPGERVVTQAQFLLDSESRIQEAIRKFRERGDASAGDRDAAARPAAGHEH